MYYSTCVGKSPTSLACPLVAKVTLIGSQAVPPSGKELLSSALLPEAQHEEEQRKARTKSTVN